MITGNDESQYKLIYNFWHIDQCRARQLQLEIKSNKVFWYEKNINKPARTIMIKCKPMHSTYRSQTQHSSTHVINLDDSISIKQTYTYIKSFWPRLSNRFKTIDQCQNNKKYNYKRKTSVT